MNFNEIRIKTELQVGKQKLEKIIHLQGLISEKDEYYVDALQFNFIHYVEFMLKICEHLSAKNNLFKKEMSSYSKIDACIKLNFIKEENKQNYYKIVSLRNRLVHEYWIPSADEVVDCCKENLELFKEFYGETLHLVSK